MIETTYFGTVDINTWEYVVWPFYFLLIVLLSARHKIIKQRSEPIYKFYLWGLYTKIFGGLFFALVYLLYYGGGDTTSYYETALAFTNLITTNPKQGFEAITSSYSSEVRYLFNNVTGYPLSYIWSVQSTFWVVRLATPFLLLGFKSYLLTTLLISWVTYFGPWLAFKTISSYYKSKQGWFAIGFLFLPSVAFWGSGLLKDSFTFAAACFLFVSVERIFFKRKNVLFFSLIGFIAAFLLLKIKAYILIAMLPGLLIWVFFNQIQSIKNNAIKALLLPVLAFVFPVVLVGFFTAFNAQLGEYSLDYISYKAEVTRLDMVTNEAYGNSFDIGAIDASPIGLLQKFPIATIYGVFSPFLWNASNPFLLLSALETTYLLGVFLLIVWRTRFLGFLVYLFKDPLLLFLVSFTLIFGFALGFTTANFGALVRFKIPMLPFFFAALGVFNFYVDKASFEKKIAKI